MTIYYEWSSSNFGVDLTIASVKKKRYTPEFSLWVSSLENLESIGVQYLLAMPSGIEECQYTRFSRLRLILTKNENPINGGPSIHDVAKVLFCS